MTMNQLEPLMKPAPRRLPKAKKKHKFVLPNLIKNKSNGGYTANQWNISNSEIKGNFFLQKDGSVNKSTSNATLNDVTLLKVNDDHSTFINGFRKGSANLSKPAIKSAKIGQIPPLSDKNSEYSQKQPNLRGNTLFSFERKSSSHQNLASTSRPAKQGMKKMFLKDSVSTNHVKPTISASTSFLDSIGRQKNQRSLSATSNFDRRLNSDARNPELAMQNALAKVDGDDWKEKVDAIQIFVYISETSPETCVKYSHAILVVLLNECKNLRSTVSRAAIVAIGKLFCNIKSKIDFDVEKICSILMQKAGDVSNAFIRDDAYAALDEVVKNASPMKVLSGLIASGSKSKNSVIRTSCASLIVKLIERIGPSQALSCPDINKLLSVLTAFAQDANPSARYQGKRGLDLLNQEPNQFEKMIQKFLTATEIRNIHGIIDSIKKRGLEISNLDTISSSSLPHRSVNCRQNSRYRANKIPDSIQSDLSEVRADLTASCWERRSAGLKKFHQRILNYARATTHDTKLMESFIGRLNDINSKISQEAMETYIKILPLTAKYFSTETSLKLILTQLINAFMSHLSSRSEEHLQIAQKCINETIANIDNTALFPALSAATRQANIKQKPFMLLSLNTVSKALYETRPRQVETIALPVLWDLFKAPPHLQNDPGVRQAVREYAIGLRTCIGEANLLNMAVSQLTPSQKKSFELLIK